MNKLLPVIIILLLIVVGVFVFKPQPKVGDIKPALLPVVKSALQIGQKPNIALNLPAGFKIGIFSSDTAQARDLQFSPGEVLLVSSPNKGEVYALPDKNNDGVADSKITVIQGENHPHGLAFYRNKLYVADVNKVVMFDWDESNLKASNRKELFDLPENNDHNSRTIIFDKTGKMFVSVGSTCNVCRENSNLSATVLTADANGGNLAVFAKGLRNAPFLQFNPTTGQLWATEMGRDNLGDNIPPDEINILEQGQDYGWPNCYGNQIHDTNFDKTLYQIEVVNPACYKTEPPTFEIAAHSAPLGLSFIQSDQFPADWQGDLLVALHGSWNRTTPIGYKVVRLTVDGNKITGQEDFLTGFLEGEQASGRPVDLEFDKQGALYVSDDKSGAIYKIIKE